MEVLIQEWGMVVAQGEYCEEWLFVYHEWLGFRRSSHN